MNEGTGETLGPATKVMWGRVTGVKTAEGCTDMKGLVRGYPAVGADAAGATTVAFQQGGHVRRELEPLARFTGRRAVLGVPSNPSARASKARCG